MTKEELRAVTLTNREYRKKKAFSLETLAWTQLCAARRFRKSMMEHRKQGLAFSATQMRFRAADAYELAFDLRRLAGLKPQLLDLRKRTKKEAA